MDLDTKKTADRIPREIKINQILIGLLLFSHLIGCVVDGIERLLPAIGHLFG